MLVSDLLVVAVSGDRRRLVSSAFLRARACHSLRLAPLRSRLKRWRSVDVVLVAAFRW